MFEVTDDEKKDMELYHIEFKMSRRNIIDSYFQLFKIDSEKEPTLESKEKTYVHLGIVMFLPYMRKPQDKLTIKEDANNNGN